MSLSLPRSPDLEEGQRKHRNTLARSKPAKSPAVSRKYPARPRRTRLIWALVCLSALYLLLSRSLLSNRIPRTPVPWPPEPNADQTSNPYVPHHVLDVGLTVDARQGFISDLPGVSARCFLAFLPHSGFNNQRIALENAMLLAYILNCSLIVPPARLGIPLPYRPFTTLEQHHLTSAKHQPDECVRGLNYTPPQCTDRRRFTLVPWNELVDLGPVRDELGLDIRFVHGSKTPRQFLYHDLGIPEESILSLKDTELYHYRICDMPHTLEEATPISKYRDEWHVDYLRTLADAFPAIHFGSLFGSGRLKLLRPEYVMARAKISRTMTISHAAILDSARVIRTKISKFSSDEGFYLAVHIRVGDRKFKGAAVKNARSIWWQLITMLGISEGTGGRLEYRALRKSRKNGNNALQNSLLTKPPAEPWFNKSAPFRPHTRCISRHRDLGVEATYLGVPLFIATDAQNPRTHPSLAIFYKTFPCIFVLKDFDADLEPLLSLRRPGDEYPSGRHLLPLVDAVVAAHATHVIGTQDR